MSAVKIVRFTNGEEVLCTVVDDPQSDMISISDTLAIALTPGPRDPQTGKQQMGFQFLPWGSMAKEGEPLNIKRNNVLYIATPVDDVIGHYNQLFSKIQTPPKNLVIAR